MCSTGVARGDGNGRIQLINGCLSKSCYVRIGDRTGCTLLLPAVGTLQRAWLPIWPAPTVLRVASAAKTVLEDLEAVNAW